MKLTAAVLGVALLVGIPAFAGTVDGKTARALVKDQKALLLDVRTDDEFKARHLEGAVNIPVEDLEKRIAELTDKKRPVVVYCKSGGRSAKAAALLKAAGFTQVHDLGGIGNW
ncbi:MAG: rhodanese-like protein [Myxococcaceae bacterium]|nr:rhodanese-like protein [Myxococcaceae bacterium]